MEDDHYISPDPIKTVKGKITFENKENQLIYKPPTEYKLEPIPGTMGVKFCQDTWLAKEFLDKHAIPYTEDQLEKTPYGLCLRIKKEQK